MSAISGYLTSILNAVYGEQVRSAIVNAITQCYDDVTNPSLNTAAFSTAIEAAYADGFLDIQEKSTIAGMTNEKIIYRYTGTAAGYIHNALYYYNGSDWVPVGSGLQTASTAAQMVDVTAIYKYTGNETGYTTNALYYHNGTEFVPISEGVVCDTELTEEGMPADAKAVGDALDELSALIGDGSASIGYDDLSFGAHPQTPYKNVALMCSTALGRGGVGTLVPVTGGEVVTLNFITGDGGRPTSGGVWSTGYAYLLNVDYNLINGKSDYALTSANVVYTFTDSTEQQAKTFTIPTGTGAKCAYFPYDSQLRNWSVVTENPELSSRTATIDGAAAAISPWYFNNQTDNFIVGESYNKTLYWSLFQAVSGMVNANILALGDSITWVSAKDGTENATQGNRPYYGYGWLTRIVRKYNMTCDIYGRNSARWWTQESGGSTEHSCCTDVAAICADTSLAEDNYDYIIIEYGTNDIWFGHDNFGTLSDVASNAVHTTTVSAVRYCIESLQNKFPLSKILVVMPFMRKASVQEYQKQYIALIDQVLDEYGVRRCYPRTEGNITAYEMNSDGVHIHWTSAEENPRTTKSTDNNNPSVKKFSEYIEGVLLSM